MFAALAASNGLGLEAQTASAESARTKGDLEGAGRIYAAEARRLREGEPARYARVLEDWGETNLAAGHYAEAAQHGRECAEALAKVPQSEERQIGCFTITGRALVYSGAYGEASEVLRRAVDVAHARGLKSSEVAALNDVGSARYYLGDYSSCFAAFSEALRLSEQHPAERWYARLHQISLANVAMLQQRVGQYERALDIYRRMEAGPHSLQLAEKARLMSNIGALYRRLGDPYKAIEQYRAAQELFAKQRDHDGEIGVTTNTGIVMAIDLGDLAGALTAFERARGLAAKSGNRREEAEARLYASEALRRLGRYADARREAEAALALALALKAPEEQWKVRLALAKISESQGDHAGALARFKGVIEIIEKLRSGLSGFSLRAAFLGDKAEAYDGAIRMLLRQPAPDAAELFRYMEEGKARTLRDRLKNPPAGATLAQVRQRLAPGTALLEYWRSGEETAALLIGVGEPRVARLGPVRDQTIDRLLEELRAGGVGWISPAAELSEALIRKVPWGRAPLERLIIVPDRRLQAIPFDVLSANGRYLIDDYEVSYLPSAAMLSATTPPRGWIAPWRRMLVAFADPVAPPGGGSLFGGELTPLPGSRDEIRGVAAQFPGQAELHAGADNRKVYLTSAHLAEVPVLHFATHAIADPDDPDRSRLALSGAPGQPLDYLFAREVYELKLSGVRLVTLAACDTEAGKVVAGEGAAALSRAFLSAGAEATVSTLWRIGDRSSAELMRRFYAALAAGEPAGRALRTAKLAARGAHPKQWAAFVLNGDPGMRTPRTVLTWPWLMTGLAALGLAALGLGLAAAGRFSGKPRRA